MEDKKTILTFNDVPLNARPSFWPMWLVAWAALTFLAGRRSKDRSWRKNALVGLLSLPLAIYADIGHALGHTFSAKKAGAPMDEILLAADMPRTLYYDNEVPPRAHKIRAVGGPIFSIINLLISLIWRQTAAPGSVNRELAEVSCMGHAAIGFGSMAPISIVDGGTLLKWTLVEQGQAEEEADTVVKNAGIGFGLVTALLGGILLIGRWFSKRKE